MATVLHRLAAWAQEQPEAAAQRYKKEGIWETFTAREFCDRVYHLALFFESKGMTRQDVGCVFGPNSYQWVHTDLATLLVGAKSAGIYPNSIAKDVQYILNHTEARFVAVANKDFYEKIRGGGEFQVPSRVKAILSFDGDTSFGPNVIGYEQALAEGKKLAQAPGAKSLQSFLDALDPNAPAFMIYTSGTTGNPKGALLSHDNLVYTSDIVSRYWSLPEKAGCMLFSFLPLCHVAEKLQCVGVGISRRYCVSFATKFDAVSQELPEVQPTLLLCVPRLWEKMMEGVTNKVNRGKGAEKRLGLWALAVGEKCAQEKYSGKAMRHPLDQIKLKVADALVLSKIRQKLGLARAEKLASGAAALPPHVSRWFRCLGLEILEDFGQTETTGVVCMTEPGVDSAGTVGKPLPGVEFKIADDGEILTRGRHVFKGYFKDDAATAAVLEGGWCHTGDLGEINERGLVRIKGRKKEILKTSGGKMVAPLPIEEELKAAPIISQVCMVGDGRKYLAALITLSEPKLVELQSRGGKAISERTITMPEVVNEVKGHIDDLNSRLASYEQIKRFAILSREFSIADGEMTPTLKMKRNVIEQRYKDVIDSMYQ